MAWSAQDAMEAYVKTVELCNGHKQEGNLENTRPLIELECTEFVSAFAAEFKAKLIVEVTTQGITPITIALALAAKQSGGKLICIAPRCGNLLKNMYKQFTNYENSELKKVMRILIGDPCEIIKEYMKIDFAVFDGKFEDHLRLFLTIDVNPKASVLVVNSNYCVRSFGQVVKGKAGARSRLLVLPIGEGEELTTFGHSCTCRKKRSSSFHVIDEIYPWNKCPLVCCYRDSLLSTVFEILNTNKCVLWYDALFCPSCSRY